VQAKVIKLVGLTCPKIGELIFSGIIRVGKIPKFFKHSITNEKH
jgi:hypothetical protein